MAVVRTGRRVLVVDDEPTVSRITAGVLRRAGCTVETAATGAEAISTASSFDPEVIVLDRHLGADDGLEVAAQLRGAHPGARILLVSGDPFELGTPRPQDSVDAFLLKPVALRDLVAAVTA